MSELTIFLLRPHPGGLQCFEAPGVSRIGSARKAREHAIRYARTLSHGAAPRRDSGLQCSGEIEKAIAFDEGAAASAWGPRTLQSAPRDELPRFSNWPCYRGRALQLLSGGISSKKSDERISYRQPPSMRTTSRRSFPPLRCPARV